MQALRNHPHYPGVKDDFMEGVSEYLSDPVVFRRALLPIEKANDFANRCGH